MITRGVLPLSSYFLWTQKGQTRLPLARGSCYIIDYDLRASFYTKHIITAAHVALPVRFPNCYGNGDLFKGLGERHITAKILLGAPERQDEKRPGRVVGDLNCNYKIDVFPTTDVAKLTLMQESSIAQCPEYYQHLFEGLKPDLTPIQPGEELIVAGYSMAEESGAPHDGFLAMRPVSYQAISVAAIQTNDFGTVVVCSTNSADEIPASISGGAVIRVKTGGVIGTVAARTALESPPPIDAAQRVAVEGRLAAHREPCVDISGFADLRAKVGPHGVAFTPINEFLNALRRLE
eukprot:GILI01037314.1.p1 GENE.GILI01037314.1~~GILI01037314.1.p1  ORF type:complete len:292 (-),score=41.32 GILI01037314.1:56-931(-)